MVDWTNGYTITSDGIDIGRDGNAVPWSRTPWSGSVDFERSTRNLVQTETIAGRTFEIYAEPDRLGRGPKGLNYDIEPADGGEKPTPFSSVMTSEAQVQEAIREYAEDLKERAEERRDANRGRDDTEEKVQTLDNGWEVWTYVDESGEQRWFVETGDGYLQSDASTASSFYGFSSQSAMETAITDAITPESVAELGYGWVLSETSGGEFIVVGRQDGERVYLESDGSAVSEKTTFASKKRARQAFRRWRDENVGEARAEANETLLEQSERFEKAIRAQSKTTVEDVEVSTTSTDTSGGSPSASGDVIEERETAQIPAVAVAVAVVVLVYLAR